MFCLSDLCLQLSCKKILYCGSHEAEASVADAAVAKQKKVALRPLGPESRGGTALLSPRKKRIVDWRDAQPSAVLPAGFRQAVSQVCFSHRTTSSASAAWLICSPLQAISTYNRACRVEYL